MRAQRAAADLSKRRIERDAETSPAQSDEIAGNTRTLTLNRTRIKSLPELIKACSVDLTEWTVDRFVCNKWEVGAKVGPLNDQQLAVEPLFQIKAWMRRRVEMVNAKSDLEDLKRSILAGVKIPSLPAPRSTRGDVMVEIGVPDLHVGKLAWAPETGFQNYDHRIAIDLFRQASSDLLNRACAVGGIGQIWFPVGNDLYHSDNRKNQTTKGTQLDSDSRYHKIRKAIRDMTIEAILRMRKIAPVKVITVPGNHDEESVLHLGDCLECRFYGDKHIEIDNSALRRKYHVWGRSLIMFSHGHTARSQKKGSYATLMAREAKQHMSGCDWFEAHLGHLHTSQLYETNGFRVRFLPSLCPPDAWHADEGYVGNVRAAVAFQWDKRAGLLGEHFFTQPN